MEHGIVNKYADMIAQEVNKYKTKMLEYFHAREKSTFDSTQNLSSSSSINNYQHFYTTSLARVTYEIEPNTGHDSDLAKKLGSPEDENTSAENSVYIQSRLANMSIEHDQPQLQTFLTEDISSSMDNDAIPFHQSFRMPAHLVQSMMTK